MHCQNCEAYSSTNPMTKQKSTDALNLENSEKPFKTDKTQQTPTRHKLPKNQVKLNITR